MKLKKEVIISVIFAVLTLFVYLYLFEFADRKIVFLYDHLGHGPFDSATVGRYWMSGFVLSALLSFWILLVLILFLADRLTKDSLNNNNRKDFQTNSHLKHGA